MNLAIMDISLHINPTPFFFLLLLHIGSDRAGGGMAIARARHETFQRLASGRCTALVLESSSIPELARSLARQSPCARLCTRNQRHLHSCAEGPHAGAGYAQAARFVSVRVARRRHGAFRSPAGDRHHMPSTFDFSGAAAPLR